MRNRPGGTPLASQHRLVSQLRQRVKNENREVARARHRWNVEKQQFLGNPVNLLLPFTAGAVVGGLTSALLGRKRRAPKAISLPELLTLGSSVWAAYQRWRPDDSRAESSASRSPS